jgi:hypothetical protein
MAAGKNGRFIAIEPRAHTIDATFPINQQKTIGQATDGSRVVLSNDWTRSSDIGSAAFSSETARAFRNLRERAIGRRRMCLETES